jgi:hypothetical protein
MRIGTESETQLPVSWGDDEPARAQKVREEKGVAGAAAAGEAPPAVAAATGGRGRVRGRGARRRGEPAPVRPGYAITFQSALSSGGMLMGQLFDTIRQLVAEEKYVVGQHASERLEERGIMEWQVVAGLEDGALIAERPDATPNPAVEVRESLPDGTEFKAVWSHLRQSGVAKLVTVHFFDRG